jgi:hypothetical protein
VTEWYRNCSHREGAPSSIDKREENMLPAPQTTIEEKNTPEELKYFKGTRGGNSQSLNYSRRRDIF